MLIPDFIAAVILTIIGVIIAEYFLHHLREKTEREKIITSLQIEASDNLDTLKANIERKELGERGDYIPFKVNAYHRYNLSLTPKLIKAIGVNAEKSLSAAYNFIEDFNRLHDLNSARLRRFEERYFHKIEENLRKFLSD